MSVLDQLYSEPAQVSHTFLGGLVVFIAALGGILFGAYRNRTRKKK